MDFVNINGFEGLYKINSQSIVKNRFGKIIKPKTHPRYGYVIISLSKNGIKKWFRIHRLVAIHFISNPDCKAEVNHKDGNKLNNDISNLEWNTPKENINHAIGLGLITKLYCSHRIKSKSLIDNIERVFESTRAASKELNLHSTTIQKALKNNSGLTKKYLFEIL